MTCSDHSLSRPRLLLPEFHRPPDPPAHDTVYDPQFPFFAHLACAAFRAISRLCSALNFCVRASSQPPINTALRIRPDRKARNCF
jgi:hypothetical protein